MPKPTNVRIGIEKRSSSRGADNLESLSSLDGVRPLSLQMGPTVIWLNALGDKEAQAIVESWRPCLAVTIVAELPEGRAWE